MMKNALLYQTAETGVDQYVYYGDLTRLNKWTLKALQKREPKEKVFWLYLVPYQSDKLNDLAKVLEQSELKHSGQPVFIIKDNKPQLLSVLEIQDKDKVKLL